MLKTLMYIELRSMLSRSNSSAKKKRGILAKIGFAILYLYIIVIFAGLFTMMSLAMCEPFFNAGIGWLYFSLTGMTAFLLSFLGSIFLTKNTLYESKFNELLLSMPIKPWKILFTRMLILYITNLMFSAVVMIPAAAVYSIKIGTNAISAAMLSVSILLIPLAALALSAIIGWIVEKVSSRLPYKNIVAVVLSLSFFVAYFWVYQNIGKYMEYILVMGGEIASAIQSWAYPVYAMGSGIADGNILRYLIFAASAIIPFAAVYAVLSKTFIKTASRKTASAKNKKAAESGAMRSPFRALLSKELRRLGSSATYMLNGAIGNVFAVFLAAAAVIKRNDITALSNEFNLGGYVIPIFNATLCLICTMNLIPAPSVSLEGKSIWFLRSMPVYSKTVLLAKAAYHFVISEPPVLLASVILLIFFPAGIANAAALILLPTVMNALIALFGLMINLLLPKLDAPSETAAIKQSSSVFFSMFGGMTICLLPILLYALLLNRYIDLKLYQYVVCAVLAVAAAVIWRWITLCGTKRFEML